MTIIPQYVDYIHSKIVQIIPNIDASGILVVHQYADRSWATHDVKCCLGFEPQVGDEIQLCYDQDKEIDGWILRKVN